MTQSPAAQATVGHRRTSGGLKGWHVLAILCCFFGTMLAANVTFVYFAISSFTGIETRDAYRRGLAYNDRLAETRAQQATGWTSTLSLGADGRPELTVRDRLGHPAEGLVMTGRIGRPSTNRFDRAVTFRHVGNGIYRVEGAALGSGQWVVTAAGHRENDPTLVVEAKARLWQSQ